MSTVISVAGLKKSYGANQAVNGVDLQISQGEIFALLGPNGAGKTTTCMKLLLESGLPFMVIVFSFMRQAIGVQQAPPNMMIMALADPTPQSLARNSLSYM